MRSIVLVCVVLLLVGCAGKRGCVMECTDCGRVELECSGGIVGNGSLIQ